MVALIERVESFLRPVAGIRAPGMGSRVALYARVSTEDQAKEGFSLDARSEEHTSELQSRFDLVCRLLLEKKNAEIRGATSPDQGRDHIPELPLVPGKLDTQLNPDEHCAALSKDYVRSHDFLFLLRGMHYP